MVAAAAEGKVPRVRARLTSFPMVPARPADPEQTPVASDGHSADGDSDSHANQVRNVNHIAIAGYW